MGSPATVRTLALDVGDRRIGIAITDRLGLTVQSRPTWTRHSIEADVGHLSKLILEEEVRRVVVGKPLHMDGRESVQGVRTEDFVERLREAVDLPVVFHDERLTSFAAEQELGAMGMDWRQRKRRVDEVAAVLILEDFLSVHGGHA